MCKCVYMHAAQKRRRMGGGGSSRLALLQESNSVSMTTLWHWQPLCSNQRVKTPRDPLTPLPFVKGSRRSNWRCLALIKGKSFERASTTARQTLCLFVSPQSLKNEFQFSSPSLISNPGVQHNEPKQELEPVDRHLESYRTESGGCREGEEEPHSACLSTK